MKIFKFYRKKGLDWQLVGLPELPSLSAALNISRLLSIVTNSDILFTDCCQRSHITTLEISKSLHLPYVIGVLLEDLTSDDVEDDDSSYDYYDEDKEEDVPTNQI